MKRYLITGNQGYVGPMVARALRARLPASRLVGVDTGWFADCTCYRLDVREADQVDDQWRRDIRDLAPRDLEGFDGVVHLAAVSNDPMGKAFEAATYEINHEGTARLASAAKAAGVSHFVFASSCSVYGQAGPQGCTEESAILPLTAYATAKARAEDELERLASSTFAVTAFRFATACGASPRVRLDLVLNDFVAAALTLGRIDILSDGTPWRPLIDVADMAEAVAWALGRADASGWLVLNTGRSDWNLRIAELARVVSETCGDVPISLAADAAPDKRSYTVDFRRCEAHGVLARTPTRALQQTVQQVRALLRETNGLDAGFRRSRLARLHVLAELHERGVLDASLRNTRR